MNRRDFLKHGMMAGVAMGTPSILKAEGENAVPREVKVGIVGCGGRGNGALKNMKAAADMLTKEGKPVTLKLVAAADFFVDKAEKTAKDWGLDEKKCYGGARGYKAVMESDAEVVILATPLNFRPIHLAAAVAAGKHVFAEKGVAVDGAGCRMFIAASREAAEKKLTIVAGTQRRHQRGYLLTADALAKGKLSPILGGEVYWNGSVPWVKQRQPGESNKAYMCRNWLNFWELSGDHICEQHVHNIDIANWYIGRYPQTALAFGARTRRCSGNQYDFFSVDFDYGQGVHIHSMCRQIDGCKNDVREYFRTANEIISGNGVVKDLNDKRIELTGDFKDGNPYDIEHYNLLKSMLGWGPYFNEGEAVAMSTACGVIGRLSAYTGQIVKLNDILTNEKSPFFHMCATPDPFDFEKEDDLPMPLYGDDTAVLPGLPWRKLDDYKKGLEALS